jgi:acylphosphatase
MIRVRFRFIGRVQGVNFRWTCRAVASRLGLSGWVRNEPDGCVSAEVQGEPEVVEKLLAVLSNEPPIRIARVEREQVPVVADEERFEITY